MSPLRLETQNVCPSTKVCAPPSDERVATGPCGSHGDGKLTQTAAKRALDRLDVDDAGLDDMDRRLLRIIIEHYDGGPAGLKALAVAVGEDSGTIEDLYEPYLIQEGFLQRTPRGRVATRRAYQHLGFPPRPGTTGTLF